MSAIEDFRTEIEALQSLHKGTIYAYNQSIARLNEKLGNKETNSDEPITFSIEGFPTPVEISSDAATLSKDLRSWYQSHLREVILVRAISTLEVFLISNIREVFLSRPDLFKKQDEISIPQSQLLSFQSLSQLNTYIINKEARKLQDSGFLGVAKFYKQRLGIDIETFDPALRKLREIHERRHLLVNRLGRTDHKYRHEYNVATRQLTIGRTYFVNTFDLLNRFSSFIEFSSSKITKKSTRPTGISTPTGVATLHVRTITRRGKSILKPSYMFEHDEQVISLDDLLSQKSVEVDGSLKIMIQGDYDQILKYISQVEKFQSDGSLIVINNQVKKQGKARQPILNDELISSLAKEIPVGNVPDGIKRALSEKYGVSVWDIGRAVHEISLARKIKLWITTHEYHENSNERLSVEFGIRDSTLRRIRSRLYKQVY